MQIRRTLAVGALSAIALTGLAGTPAVADIDFAAVDCTTVEGDIDQAKDDFKVARLAFKSANRPMGKLIKVEREEARAAARDARASLKSMIRELKKSDSGRESREVIKDMKAERREIAKLSRLADSHKLLRAEVREARRDAKRSWEDVKDDLRELRQYRSANCEGEEPEVEEPEVEEPEVEDENQDGTVEGGIEGV